MKRVNRRYFRCLLFVVLFVVFSMIVGSGSVYAAKLNRKTIYIPKGGTFKLKVLGSGAKVKWKSANKKIATVSKKGKVKGVSIGKTKITAKVGGKKLNCKVIVEDPGANNARVLRDYLLSKGKYDKSTKTYCIKKTTTDSDTGCVTETLIGANKKNKKLVFYCQVRPDSPAEIRTMKMTIDLISGKEPVRTGTIEYIFKDAYSDADDFTFRGNITTAFSSSGSGLTAARVDACRVNGETGDAEDVVYTGAAETKPFTERTGYQVSSSFAEWNKLMKADKTLKKKKITMKALGFK